MGESVELFFVLERDWRGTYVWTEYTLGGKKASSHGKRESEDYSVQAEELHLS
jgi:hypothetical protein